MNREKFGFLPMPGSKTRGTGMLFARDGAVTADFSELAKNHCCATMLLNYCRLLEDQGRLPKELSALSDRELFSRIHRFVPNGPILTLRRRAPRLFARLAIPAKAVRLPLFFTTPAHEKAEVLAQCVQVRKNPAALLVAAGPLSWHWILAVGSGRTRDKSLLYVVTGWHRKVMCYVPDAGCHILAAWELSSSASFTSASSS